MKPIGEIMKHIHLPAPDSETRYSRTSETESDVCPICNGAGYVRIDAPVDSPNFSRLIQCTCRRRDRAQRHAADVGEFTSIAAVRQWTFETFDPDVNESVREAYERAFAFARDPYGWLVLYGEYGCGKTHLAAAIANYAQDELDMRPVFAVVPDLLDYLRATFAPSSETRYEARFEAIRAADLLVLDDLGTENATDWAKEKLYQIVNFRYMERLPTVFTTNVDPDRIDPRVFSRMFDGALSDVKYIDAPDYRLRRANLPPRQRRRTGRS